MQHPRQPHMDAALCVLRFLKSSLGKDILLPLSNNLQLLGYSDFDWASCPTTCCSVIGFCTFIGESPISWRTKKQSIVSRSTAKDEYRATVTTTCELVWLKHLLHDLGFAHSQPMHLYCDNQAALHIASNLVFHERTKRIELDCHVVREKLQARIISTKYLRTNNQRADIFTKPLGKDRFDYLQHKLGIFDPHTHQLEG
ncbi:hypothetical protein AMTRI_Chr09g40320 [Amborella trichopoda]